MLLYRISCTKVKTCYYYIIHSNGPILFMLFGNLLSSCSKLCYEKLKTMFNYSLCAYKHTHTPTYLHRHKFYSFRQCASAAMMVKTCANLCMQMHLQYFEHLSIFLSLFLSNFGREC